MITNANLTLSELKQLFVELLVDRTSKVSDVGDDSVLNGVAFGVAKTGQKAMKDIAIVESQIFPETAKGQYLDRAADLFGVSPRRGAVGSSTYVRIVADDGTQYLASTHTFISSSGIQFLLDDDVTVGVEGYIYAKVKSVDTGEKCNVDANSITTVTPVPTGHVAVTNEYMATGGIDEEDDETFRMRIINNNNFLSQNTIEYYTQMLQNIDDRVLKVFNGGVNEDGVQLLIIVTVNGVDLTDQELDDLLEQSKPYLSITNINQYGNVVNLKYINVTYFEVDMDFRVEIESGYDQQDVRRQIQINISKYFDYRFWENGGKIEWDDLLQIVKNTEGVKYVADEYFIPGSDMYTLVNTLPRVRGFIMRDLDNNIIYSSNNLALIYYPN